MFKQNTQRSEFFMRVFFCLLLSVTSIGCSHQPLKTQNAKPEQKTLKVMTFNVNFGIAGDDATLKTIANSGADVVLLQETTAPWQQAIEYSLRKQYPHQSFRHCCGAGGLAVLSRFPFENKQYVPAPKPGWFPAWRVVVDSPLGKVQMLNVHLRPPVSDEGSFVSGYFSTQDIRRKEMVSHLKTLAPSMPTIVAGDFNENAKGDAVKVLKDKQMVSVLPQFHGDTHTWRWPTRFLTLRAQLDHIVYDRQRLKPLDAKVLRQGRSDHYPVMATFTHQTPKGFTRIKQQDQSSLSMN